MCRGGMVFCKLFFLEVLRTDSVVTSIVTFFARLDVFSAKLHNTMPVIMRPPDIVVGEHRFYHGFFFLSFFFLSFFVSYPRSLLNGTLPKPATCSKVSAI